MGFSTYSGPLRAGTVKEGAARNTGLPVLTQSVTIPFSAMTTSPTAQDLFILPAGAKIMRFVVEKTTAISGGSVSNVALTIGTSADADLYQTTANIATAAGRTTQSTLDAALVVSETDNIGTSDVTVQGTFTAATGNPTAGSAVVTVQYVQRAADGAQFPASA